MSNLDELIKRDGAVNFDLGGEIMGEQPEIYDLNDIMEVPNEFYTISEPKLQISKILKEVMEQKELTLRELAKKIGMKHPQIVRVTSGNNYNIDTLLRILDGLDLEIEIKKRI